VSQPAVMRHSETASTFVPDNTEQQWFWVRLCSSSPWLGSRVFSNLSRGTLLRPPRPLTDARGVRQVDVPHLATSCGLPSSTPLLDALQPEGATASLDNPPVRFPVLERG
jgi:hypothetical protein